MRHQRAKTTTRASAPPNFSTTSAIQSSSRRRSHFPSHEARYIGDDPSAVPCLKVLGELRGRERPYRPQSIINVSAMSFGSLGERAVRALNRGVRDANAFQNTGEGGLSVYHREGGRSDASAGDRLLSAHVPKKVASTWTGLLELCEFDRQGASHRNQSCPRVPSRARAASFRGPRSLARSPKPAESRSAKAASLRTPTASFKPWTG